MDNELIDLIKKRSNIYSKALYEIKCDNLSKNEIVRKILKIYETIKLIIKTKTQKYPIIIGSNLIPNISKIAKITQLSLKMSFVVDENISKNIISKN